jgi:hypothetical protein
MVELETVNGDHTIILFGAKINVIDMFLVLIPWPSNISGRYGGNTEVWTSI